MPWLEDRIRPPRPSRPWRRDVLHVVMLAGLSVVLLGASDADGVDVVGQMFSFYLLLSLGFLLALRCGAIDLSVWMTAGMGGLAAGYYMSSGGGVNAGFLAAAAVGLLIGVMNFVLVRLARVPSIIVTGAVAVAGAVACRYFTELREIAINQEVINPWLEGVGLQGYAGLADTVLVSWVYGAVVIGLLLYAGCIMHRRGKEFGDEMRLGGGFVVSGLLCGLAGAIWITKYSAVPVPTMPIGDLRVPAAAILAGGVFLASPGRIFLSVLSLPVALLLATVWRQDVWHVQAGGFELQMLILAGMLAFVQITVGKAADNYSGGGKIFLDKFGAASFGATFGGVLVVAAAAHASKPGTARIFHVAGAGLFLTGAAAMLLSRAIIAIRQVWQS